MSLKKIIDCKKEYCACSRPIWRYRNYVSVRVFGNKFEFPKKCKNCEMPF